MKKSYLPILLALSFSAITFFRCENGESLEEVKKNPSSIELLSGDNQTAHVETSLPNSIVVLVTDQDDQPYKGAVVKFSVEEGAISSDSLVSDENGEVSVLWTLGKTDGTQSLLVTAFGEDVTTPLEGSPIEVTSNAYATMTDHEGNVYKAVTIGDQFWMAENLKVETYNDGAAIPHISDKDEWTNLTSPGYCWYDNNETTYKDIHGALYNWYTVETDKVCPSGWHVPSDDDWKTLELHLGMSNEDADDFGTRGFGLESKLINSSDWSRLDDGENETRLTLLPSGYRYEFGLYEGLGEFGRWWSSTKADDEKPIYRGMYNPGISRTKTNLNFAASIRCIKD